MNYSLKKSLLLFVLISLLTACSKDPGVGGDAKIQGTLTLLQYDKTFTTLVDEKSSMDTKVYIVYGDAAIAQDDVDTSPDGYFEFDYLYEGEYTIYYYTEDSLGTAGEEVAHQIVVNISDDEQLDIGELHVIETLDVDEGKGTITGTVYEVFYSKNYDWPYASPQDTFLAVDQEVYLRYNDHDFYFDRIRTQPDGSFYFENLIPGDYTVYVFSNFLGETEDQTVAVEQYITVEHDIVEPYTCESFYVYDQY